MQSFQHALLAWYAEHKRDLPWRRTTEPYAILVSEVMLQQTQVERVIPKYEAFLIRFPTMHALAAASMGDVLMQWSGLGFNRRAVNLRATATQLVGQHFPARPEELRQLKGIGEYTSRAVASFAFNYPVAVVDINVKRVYNRLFLGNTWVDDRQTHARLDALAQEMFPKEDSRTWNNAIMDFGATVCTAASPSCRICPFSQSCKAYGVAKDSSTVVLIAAKPQSQFAGSTRYYRGQLLKILKREKAVHVSALVALWKKEAGWVQTLTETMLKEGLIEMHDGRITFP